MGRRAAADSRLGPLAVVLLALILWLPGFASLPVVDRDEARFAQASRQMLEVVTLSPGDRGEFHSGGWTVPRIQDRDRLSKPPLIYWLQAGAGWLATAGDPARDDIWIYRLPSLLAALVLLWLTYRLGRALDGRRTGLLAAVFLALSPIVAWEARQARIDLVLTACIVAAQLCLWRHLSGRGRVGTVPAFWLLTGLGILAKGPVAALVVGATLAALALDRSLWPRLRALRPAIGLPAAAAMSVPWLLAVAARSGSDILTDTAARELVGRFLAPMESHGAPPGTHLILAGGLLWPGSLLLVPAGVLLVRRVKARGTLDASPAGRFLLAWVVPSWIFFELSRTKLPHYTLPLLPAVAIALAAAANRLPRRMSHPLARVGIGAWWGWTLIVLLIPAPLLVAAAGHHLGAAILAGLGVTCTAFVGRELLRSQWRRAVVAAGVGAAVVLPAVLWSLPRWQEPWISQRVLETVRDLDPELDRPLVAIEYQEDSLLFLSRGRWRRLGESDLAAWIEQHPDGLVLAPAASLTPSLVVLARIRGFWYSKGRWAELALAAPRGARPPSAAVPAP